MKTLIGHVAVAFYILLASGMSIGAVVLMLEKYIHPMLRGFVIGFIACLIGLIFMLSWATRKERLVIEKPNSTL